VVPFRGIGAALKYFISVCLLALSSSVVRFLAEFKNVERQNVEIQIVDFFM
jgi:hypothetical protein